jgi:hypothetical protein
MIYEDIKVGQVLNVVEYNKLSHAKWHRDYDKARLQGRDWGCMPQVAFYGFYHPKTGELRKTGFVRKTERGSHWFKLKRDALAYVEKVY